MASFSVILLAIACIATTTTSKSLPNPWNPLRPWWNARIHSTAGRIVGGYEVDIVDVPFQVSLQYSDHFCGGSVISSTWVLTAGHCVASSENPGLNVRVGSSYHATGGQLVAVRRVVRHPQYDEDGIDYDFALMELTEELKLDEKFFAVELPDQDEPVQDGTCLQVSGWGYTQNVLESREVLRATTVPAVNQEKCAEAYGSLTPRMLCAGFDKGGKDACQGDSGGPLVEGSKLVGVVSWGQGCALEGFPGVYSRVASVREWIKETSGV